MQANSLDNQSFDVPPRILEFPNTNEAHESRPEDGAEVMIAESAEPIHFRGYYTNCMEMWAKPQTVEDYLDVHSEWFRRCASPMTAEPLGENGYALSIGKFGALGYEVEPKIGLHLLPQDEDGFYRIETIPIPDYTPPGYDVDFKAALHLIELPIDEAAAAKLPADAPRVMSGVEWELHLDVAIHFPRFIHALPQSLIQSTGDRLLNQIVRQVSRRLTLKVQEDFHASRNLPFPKKARRYPWASRHATTPSAEELG